MAERALFEARVLPHLDAMLRAAAALVGATEAEDVAQEALVRAWRAWHGLRDAGAVRPWLLRITVNVCREWRRGSGGRGRARTFPFPDGDTVSMTIWVPLGGVGGVGHVGTDSVGTSDHTGALDLREALSTLEGGLRLIVVLRFYGGMDATEIGAVLDMPASTVRTRLVRALSLLRERLGRRRDGRSSPPRGGMYA